MGKILFASDFHLGVPNAKSSLQREKKLVRWLELKGADAEEIFFVGDVFDFWFEYKHVIPKGYSRLFGCLAKLADSGVKLHFFKGNHDMWMFGYFIQEFGAQIHSNEHTFEHNGKSFFVHHGDGLGNGDANYKILKKFFRSQICQRMFAFLHPSVGIGLANFFSARSRAAQLHLENKEVNLEKEWLVQYCKDILEKKHYDFMIFGHRHLALDVPLSNNSRYVNLGDWLSFYTYAEFDGTVLALKTFDE